MKNSSPDNVVLSHGSCSNIESEYYPPHHTILNIECEADRGNIADIGTGHCWQLARYCLLKILSPKLYCQQ